MLFLPSYTPSEWPLQALPVSSPRSRERERKKTLSSLHRNRIYDERGEKNLPSALTDILSSSRGGSLADLNVVVWDDWHGRSLMLWAVLTLVGTVFAYYARCYATSPLRQYPGPALAGEKKRKPLPLPLSSSVTDEMKLP